MIIPLVIFGIVNWLASFEIAITTLIVLGLIGILFHQKIMDSIIKKYLSSKYKMIDAFGQNN